MRPCMSTQAAIKFELDQMTLGQLADENSVQDHATSMPVEVTRDRAFDEDVAHLYLQVTRHECTLYEWQENNPSTPRNNAIAEAVEDLIYNLGMVSTARLLLGKPTDPVHDYAAYDYDYDPYEASYERYRSFDDYDNYSMI